MTQAIGRFSRAARRAVALLFMAAPIACSDAVRDEGPACRGQAAVGMVWVPPGPTRLGSGDSHPEEGPPKTVHVGGFWIDAHEVTNAEYGNFVRATGYVTLAERAPAGTVFDPDAAGGNLWRLDPSAKWRQPHGAGSAIDDRDDYPVVQIAYEDALAYARWKGHDLPTEAEWERAARGGLASARYTWGNEPRPGGEYHANHHQGPFPIHDAASDGFDGLAPVGCFPANGYGLFDMAGNVWEWTKDPWVAAEEPAPGSLTVKGGSFLCSDSFCQRYRPASRQPADPTLGTEHTGFRTVLRRPIKHTRE